MKARVHSMQIGPKDLYHGSMDQIFFIVTGIIQWTWHGMHPGKLV